MTEVPEGASAAERARQHEAKVAAFRRRCEEADALGATFLPPHLIAKSDPEEDAAIIEMWVTFEEAWERAAASCASRDIESQMATTRDDADWQRANRALSEIRRKARPMTSLSSPPSPYTCIFRTGPVPDEPGESR
jgi:hypothetical protein